MFHVTFSVHTTISPYSLSVTVYNCEFMGSNCAQCIALEDRYGCSYCGPRLTMEGDCVFSNTSFCNGKEIFQEIGNCDPPMITDVSCSTFLFGL